MDKKLQHTDGNYLFNVDILINARTNPLALQYLLEMLNNSDKITDFNINSGLELGRTIDTLLRSAKLALKNESYTPTPVSVKLPEKPADKPAERPPVKKPPVVTPAETPADVFGKIRQYIQNNQLVRLRANRHGKQVSMPCRILNFDEGANSLSVYHVDEKQVYTFNLNEIDEFL
ncbi:MULTISPECIES: hypothetical protein [Paenibacillus]|jgi:hypothetical protein|uniref:hypothetical protein n=1 Tax=Paenibacillus TaxID=44249 RepID=UPI0004F8C825|nr:MULTISPECIES: hypothetical protein [unclassified Paenibacillus]AIQ28611.1 hypothetical protein P40081_10845 [Paenibacillus sp. FSL P4-0081]OMF33433.1 hypothetical protein BK132_04340 [Paenibacillus sp. FSL H8-0259]